MDKEAAARRPLYRMFNEVPGSYDIMNRILTLGQDERWRKKAVNICLKEDPEQVLDICTGTADLALRIAKTSTKKRNCAGSFKMVISPINLIIKGSRTANPTNPN